jgi:hypothetical protein
MYSIQNNVFPRSTYKPDLPRSFNSDYNLQQSLSRGLSPCEVSPESSPYASQQAAVEINRKQAPQAPIQWNNDLGFRSIWGRTKYPCASRHEEVWELEV